MRKLFILTLLLGASAVAQNYVQFPPANRYPNAQYFVCAFPPAGNPCSNQILVYPTSALGLALAQPITTVSDGSSAFWVSSTVSQVVIEVQRPIGATFIINLGGAGSGANFSAPPPLGNITPNSVSSTTLTSTSGIQALPTVFPFIAGDQDPNDVCQYPNSLFNAGQQWIMCSINPGVMMLNWGLSTGNQQILLGRPLTTVPANGNFYGYVSADGMFELNPASVTLPTVSTYNGIATVSGGIPIEVQTVDLTAQTNLIGTTTLFTTVTAGQYRLNWNAKVTQAASSSSTLGALTITYIDPDGVTQTIVAGALSKNGAIETTDTGNSTTSVLLGVPLVLNCKAATAITYAMSYASSISPSMQFNLHLKLEQM